MSAWKSSALAALAVAAFSAPAVAGDHPPVTPEAISLVEQNGGQVFKSKDELALYIFDKDTAGKSVCNDRCAVAWPPVAATKMDKAVGEWTIVTRDDGALQWAYKGMPVYTYVKDDASTIAGDGVGGVWHLAKP
ncbi:MAG: hypothetical protein AB7P23_02285 [Amphiplicatus sp.]